jgi:glycosyltransferase involved in cell wall biosynthesis
MKVLVWHGWLLEGAGSNVYAARVVEALRRAGHDVLLLCQERHPERYDFLDRWGTVDDAGVRLETDRPAPGGRATLLRPSIGPVLPVFVYDEYEETEVERFVDLSDDDLGLYIERNVAALRVAAEWHAPDVVIAGHAVPGPVVARRAIGEGRYVAKIHGSDLEYAVRAQTRYRDMAAEGLSGARAIVGATRDVLERTEALVPGLRPPLLVVPPGVSADRFLIPDDDAIEATLASLEADPDSSRGRGAPVETQLARAVRTRDADAIERLARTYDQTVPDPDAAATLRELRSRAGPVVGYFGKLIPQKGVHQLLLALPQCSSSPRALVVGFGLFREWLQAISLTVEDGDGEALEWVLRSAGLEEPEARRTPASGLAHGSVGFTGRLDHRYAPAALASMDVLVVPSVLDEAFGMVSAEGAAAGALPLVARHSGLADIAAALEGEVGRPGMFSFRPGEGSVDRIREGIDRLLEIRPPERRDLARRLSRFVSREWTWERTAERLLSAAQRARSPGAST